MKTLDEFVISFKGLDVGNHVFNFELNQEFFDSFEYFENINGHANVGLTLTKESNMMLFNFKLAGKLQLQCDRCLDYFDFDIEGSNRLIVKYGDEFKEESEDVIVIPITESRIDLKQYIFEYLSVLIPYRKIHPLDKDGNSLCDKEVIKMIEGNSEFRNDPRWDALKDLKSKLEEKK